MDRLRTYLWSSLKDNILPIPSVCNVRCVFCSHRQNPPGIESYFLPPLGWGDLEELVDFLSPERKVVIGESTTRIMEGEPFTHPRIIDLLKMIRGKLPEVSIQITTNGTLLTRKIIKELKAMAPLEVVISLNSACTEKREILMGRHPSAQALEAVKLMAEEGLSFHGSMVPLPWLTGWDDAAKTIDFLDRHQARTIRIFLPGFTRYSPEEMVPPPHWEEDLRSFVAERRSSCVTPLTLEPSGVTDLQAMVTGVTKNSPAWRAGLLPGDEIISINGLPPFSRVDAFYNISSPGRYRLEVVRGQGEKVQVEMNLPGEKSGLVMDYDLARETVDELLRRIGQGGADKPLILASQWGAPLLKEGLRKAGAGQLAEKVIAVPNETFGGNIKAAGLLLVEDFSRVAAAYIEQGGAADLLLLPSLAFDAQGRDLKGQHFLGLEEKFKLKVLTV